jgi:PAS domain S-box-containing protein
MESRCLGKDGKSVWVQKNVSLVRDAQGRPQWIVAVIEDITERRQTEEALREAGDARRLR